MPASEYDQQIMTVQNCIAMRDELFDAGFIFDFRDQRPFGVQLHDWLLKLRTKANDIKGDAELFNAPPPPWVPRLGEKVVVKEGNSIDRGVLVEIIKTERRGQPDIYVYSVEFSPGCELKNLYRDSMRLLKG
jgi:hypothetical protein